MPKRKKSKRRSRGGASYLCPRPGCGQPSHVIITRRDEDGAVRRVRECHSCDHKFQTEERATS